MKGTRTGSEPEGVKALKSRLTAPTVSIQGLVGRSSGYTVLYGAVQSLYKVYAVPGQSPCSAFRAGYAL
jgi:hypothetical protein